MNSKIKITFAAATLAAAAGALAQSEAQSLTIHPSHGQSADQQARDEARCHTLARKRTGYDPLSIAENSTPLQPGKGMTSVPIEAPTMAMGSSGGGATGAGAETGTAPPAGTGGGAMGASQAGMTGAGAEAPPASAGGAAGAGTAATGASAAGATGAGGEQLAMQNSMDVYNRAFGRCMASHGYTVEMTSAGTSP